MAASSEIFEKLNLINGNENIKAIFRTIARQIGMSGWEVAKQVDIDRKDVEKILSDLKKEGIVRSTGPGLDGNYGLTDLGFELRERIFAGSQSRAL